MQPTKRVLIVLVFLALLTTWLRFRGSIPKAKGPLPHDVYIWQRDWTDPVRTAVLEINPTITLPVFLAAEVTWQNNQPTVARVPIDYSTLGGRPFGLALRIGAIDPDKIDRAFLAGLAKSLIEASPVPPRELQIDFDCAESKLDGYRRLIESLKPAVAPVPVVITALPAWLDQNAFTSLAKLGPYVLQVHSLQRPTDATSAWKLIDPPAAKRDVRQAARIGVPFRVALPTYGCVAVFDEHGKFLRIYSENVSPIQDGRLTTKYLMADPAEIAHLIRDWSVDRPAAMTGVIWYRLPVSTDQLNWRSTTLAAVMAGRTPAPRLTLVADPKGPLVDLTLVNDGDADASLPPQLKASWTGETLIAADAINGYTLDPQAASVTLSLTGRAKGRTPEPADTLRPGDRRAVGWLRFAKDTEVHGHVATPP